MKSQNLWQLRSNVDNSAKLWITHKTSFKSSKQC